MNEILFSQRPSFRATPNTPDTSEITSRHSHVTCGTAKSEMLLHSPGSTFACSGLHVSGLGEPHQSLIRAFYSSAIGVHNRLHIVYNPNSTSYVLIGYGRNT
jgi:hypothetical protein